MLSIALVSVVGMCYTEVKWSQDSMPHGNNTFTCPLECIVRLHKALARVLCSFLYFQKCPPQALNLAREKEAAKGAEWGGCQGFRRDNGPWWLPL
jgi:hypothetical protein